MKKSGGRARNVAQVVDTLSSKQWALSSRYSIAKKGKKILNWKL
jgi:hypothetical protein